MEWKKIVLFVLWVTVFIMDILVISDVYRFNDNPLWLRIYTWVSLGCSWMVILLMFLTTVPSYIKKKFDEYIDRRILDMGDR